LFNAFPFDDTLFETHSKQDYFLSDETFLEDESYEENSLELHGIAPHVPLFDNYFEESEIEDLGDDVVSRDLHFEDIVEDIVPNPFQLENIPWLNEYNQ
jgi:hypothetical protein